MDTTILESLGLSKGEIKIYLTLLEIGKTKVGNIIEKSGMASSAVHNSIRTLTEKGLISFSKEGKIKHYQAIPPKQLLDFIENKKKKLKEILPELESLRNKPLDKQEAEVFKGIKGIIAMLNILIEGTRKGDGYFFFAINIKEQNKEIREFFKQYDLKRKDKGLVMKGLAPKELKPLFENRKIIKMKYPSAFIPTGISICNNKVAFYSWDKKPVGFLLRSKQISNMYEDYFNAIWNIN